MNLAKPMARKLAVVTGGSRGIGRGISRRLASDGFEVAVHYATNRDAADQTVADIHSDGGSAFCFSHDLRTSDDGSAFWARCDQAGQAAGVTTDRLSVLVNCAGISPRTRIEETTEKDFDEVFAVNFRSIFFLIRAGLDRIERNGRIVNISSGGTRVAIPDYLAYSTSKGALDVFTHALAKQLGPRGITVNAVSPGVVDTEMNAWWLTEPGALERAASEIAMGRIGQPEDIADIVGFLASDASRWVTGQLIDATGGAQL